MWTSLWDTMSQTEVDLALDRPKMSPLIQQTAAAPQPLSSHCPRPRVSSDATRGEMSHTPALGITGATGNYIKSPNVLTCLELRLPQDQGVCLPQSGARYTVSAQ